MTTRPPAPAPQPTRRPPSQRRDREGGFTLLELLVVLVILSLVMGLVGPRVLGYLSDARSRTAGLQIASLEAALDLYYLDHGRFPNEREGLSALVANANDPSWKGPYLENAKVPVDPWGRDFAYRIADATRRYSIVSFGADGVEGGSDEARDIVGR